MDAKQKLSSNQDSAVGVEQIPSLQQTLRSRMFQQRRVFGHGAWVKFGRVPRRRSLVTGFTAVVMQLNALLKSQTAIFIADPQVGRVTGGGMDLTTGRHIDDEHAVRGAPAVDTR